MIKKTEQEEPNERPGEPLPWHVKMTRRNCTKKGHVAALCPDNEIKMSDQTADANVQEGQVDEEAAQQLLDGSRLLANENEELCADLLSCEDQERRSASFQLKDESPIWRSWELELVLLRLETRFWFDRFFGLYCRMRHYGTSGSHGTFSGVSRYVLSRLPYLVGY